MFFDLPPPAIIRPAEVRLQKANYLPPNREERRAIIAELVRSGQIGKAEVGAMLPGLAPLLVGVGGPPGPSIATLFATTQHTGTGSSLAVNPGLDFSGSGGLILTKGDNASLYPVVSDTSRGINRWLTTYSTQAESIYSTVNSFTSTGYVLGNDQDVNYPGIVYTSHNFIQNPRFFSVFQYTGNGINRSLSHGLAGVPGMIWIKRKNGVSSWTCWHNALAAGDSLYVEEQLASQNRPTEFPSLPTSTTISLGTSSNVNANGALYVAYVFAHDAAADGVIKCGSYNGSGGPTTVTLGWAPQFLLIKSDWGSGGSWIVQDSTRGQYAAGTVHLLDLLDSYYPGSAPATILTDGFRVDRNTVYTSNDANGATKYVYMAVRAP